MTASSLEHYLESAKLVVLGVGAAIVYGVVHDQVTARVCLEYFTVAHPDVVGHDPTVIALYWGVVATWWVGLPLGIGLAIASRAGDRTPASVRDASRRVAKLLAVLFGVAMSAGAIAYVLAELGQTSIGGRFARTIPAAHHHAFLFDAWAHTTSYLSGALGGLSLCAWTFWSRAKPGAPAVEPWRTGLSTFGCVALVASPLLCVGTWIALFNYSEMGGGGYSPEAMGPIFYASYVAWPWLAIAIALAGAAALVAGYSGRRK